MRFLRTLGESLRWEDDRVAMALFAHMATPQIRLTKDPNTYFFFLDHLEDVSPFRLEDDGTWDTNIERGIYWGLRLIDKDQELRKGTKIRAGLRRAHQRAGVHPVVRRAILERRGGQVAGARPGGGVPVNVIGVGTTAGGIIPDPKRDVTKVVLRSVLNRSELTRIATAGGGRYYELDRENDREIANTIIEQTRRRVGTRGLQEGTQDLYWNFLAAAAGLVGLGVLFLRDRMALALQVTAAAAVLLLVTAVF